MSADADSDPRPETPVDGDGVLAKLPRTRPQRASARRAAARKASSPAAAVSAQPAVSTAASDAASANGSPGAPRTASAGAKSSPRRGGPKGRSAAPKAKTATAPRQRSGSAKRSARPAREKVPRQGFESDVERASGPVQPPGGAEFIATAAEIVNEIAKAGISTGERLLRDVISRLPTP